MRDRYNMGVSKLLTTAEAILEMQSTLKGLQPQLIATSLETEQILQDIEKQKQDADEARTLIKGEEKQAEKNAAEARKISIMSEVSYRE